MMFPSKRWARVCAIALSAVLLVACSGVSTRALPSMTAAPSGMVVLQPTPRLYVSGQPADSDWRAFADAGVKTVINLRTVAEMKGRDERGEVVSAGMQYIELPIDGAAALTSDRGRRLGELLRDARGPVLLHCHSGNRAGGLLALAKADEGMPAQDALALGRAAGMKSTETRVRQVLGLAPAEQTAP